MIITFNGKSNTDFNGLTIAGTPSIPSPEKDINKDSAPGISGFYDFSTVASNGETVYKQREIQVKFNLVAKTDIERQKLYSAILEWLAGPSGLQQIQFDFDPGFFYLGQVESAITMDVPIKFGTLTVTFICDPFKYSNELYGDLLWDNINFDLPDYIQTTKFVVSGSKTVTIYVPANHNIVPNVVVDSNMACTLNGYTANFTTNNDTDWQFILKPGANNISITGTGNIDFQFRKKVL